VEVVCQLSDGLQMLQPLQKFQSPITQGHSDDSDNDCGDEGGDSNPSVDANVHSQCTNFWNMSLGLGARFQEMCAIWLELDAEFY
jgi:hypothetical protein